MGTDNLSRESQEIRSRILNGLIIAYCVLTLPAVISGIRSNLQLGWVVGVVFLCIGYASLLGCAVFAKRLPFWLRGTVFLSVFFLTGVALLSFFGLCGAGLLMLMTCATLTSVIFGVRYGLITLASSAITVAVISVLMANGTMQVSPQVMGMVDSLEAWASGSFVFTMLALASVLSPGVLYKNMMQAMRLLSERSQELEARNVELGEMVAQRRRDELELNELQQQLVQAQKMDALGRLAGGVAHDFNNLLTVIHGNTELALESGSLDDDNQKILHEVRFATTRAGELTRHLLAFSRKQPQRRTRLDIVAVVEQMQSMLRRLIDATISIDVVKRVSSAVVEADQGQLEQIIVNLAVNARDAMPAGGTLRFEIEAITLDEQSRLNFAEAKAGEYVRIRVSDTGIGMDEQTQRRVFEPFFSTKSSMHGVGLGLATVYGLVVQHNGSIRVQSKPGQGAVFELVFPVLAYASVEATDKPQLSELPTGSEHILIVEDEPMVRRILKRTLETLGYQLSIASSAEQALEMLVSDELDVQLLLTDLVLPGMDGAALATQLRSQRPQLRVLFTSGYARDFVKRGELSIDEQAFLAKPFSPQQLAQRVREILDSE